MSYPQAVINRTLKTSLDNIRDMNPAARKKFSRFISDVLSQLGIPLLVYSTNRTMMEQDVLFEKYLRGGPKAAKPGYSWHNFNRAGDSVPVLPNGEADWKSPYWPQIGAIAIKHGLSWGKSFGDTVHFSDRSGTTLEKLRASRAVVKKGDNQSGAVTLLILGITIYSLYRYGKR